MTKKPTKKQLFIKIQESQERLIASLMGAWESAPSDPKIKKEILDSMENAMKLRAKIYKDVLGKTPPAPQDSYKKLKSILQKEGLLK